MTPERYYFNQGMKELWLSSTFNSLENIYKMSTTFRPTDKIRILLFKISFIVLSPSTELAFHEERDFCQLGLSLHF